MDKGQCTELTIHRMPEGGYVVVRSGGFDRGVMSTPLFASGEVDKALGFIKDQIVPIQAAAEPWRAEGRKPTIAELEKILRNGNDSKIDIQPDGSIRAVALPDAT